MAHILVMEDDIPLGIELAQALQNDGHDVVLARSASDAKEKLWHWDFDLLITDMIVRQGNRPVPDGGLGLISWVRHQAMTTPGLNYLPIVAISGEQIAGAAKFLLATADVVGADVVMEKPLSISKLLDEIETLTARNYSG